MAFFGRIEFCSSGRREVKGGWTVVVIKGWTKVVDDGIVVGASGLREVDVCGGEEEALEGRTKVRSGWTVVGAGGGRVKVLFSAEFRVCIG